jgi:hypothetical protein
VFVFSVESTFGELDWSLGFFAADATTNAPGLPADNTGVSNVGNVEVPFPSHGDPRCAFEPTNCVVPEPGTVLLVVSGLIALGIYRRRQG